MTVENIALAQINPTIGDFEANRDRILEYVRRARNRGADLVLFPELAVCGYPPQDLLQRPAFLDANRTVLDELVERIEGIDAVIGFADRNAGTVGKQAHNAAALIRDGRLEVVHHKMLLPTYDVFDEARHFEPGESVTVFGEEDNIGLTVCEDIWNDSEFSADYGQPRYETNPLELFDLETLDVLVNISASPYVRGKDRRRTEMIRRLAEKYQVKLVLCNMVGGNDSLIFDGNSLIADENGDVLQKGAGFSEDLLMVELPGESPVKSISFPDEPESVYEGLKLGLRDYLDKCGFEKALIGLSGGIDSSLTATLAADALGPENILGVMMPSEISSESSVEDAEELADNLEINTRVYPIRELFKGYLQMFEGEFEGMPWDHTEENLQARIRGNILMALSNKYGHILLTTGNKSELAVGYCTLYGDMNGGLAVISDVPKTMVYELCEYRNQQNHVIPRRVFEKAPSAELSPDQKDEDELPPYPILDDIMRYYVEEHMPPDEIVEKGFDEAVVQDVVKRIDLNEYKRQQAPIGLKITTKSFGMGWRMPIAQHFEIL